MKEYIVNITNEALADMEKIYDYIAKELQAPDNALNQYNRIADAILSLKNNPERCSVFDEEPEHSWGMRKLIIDNYVACYIVDPGIVTITDILYGASNIHERLKNKHV